METHEMIRQLMGSAKLRKLQDKTEEEEEEQDMWKAVEDLVACEYAGKTPEEYQQARTLL